VTTLEIESATFRPVNNIFLTQKNKRLCQQRRPIENDYHVTILQSVCTSLFYPDTQFRNSFLDTLGLYSSETVGTITLLYI
jgi:hypothetical protein